MNFQSPRQQDFMYSSQLEAIKPVMNGSAGPSLIQDYSFPIPTYKTQFPITINQQNQQVTVKFLAKTQNQLQVNIKNSNIIANTSTFLEKVQAEVYQATLFVSPQGFGMGSSQLEILEFGKPVCYVIVQYQFQQLQQSSATSSMQLSSNLPAVSANQPFNAYYQPMASSTYQPYSASRHHSQYCYEDIPIPDNLAQAAQQANLQFSQGAFAAQGECAERRVPVQEEHAGQQCPLTSGAQGTSSEGFQQQQPEHSNQQPEGKLKESDLAPEAEQAQSGQKHSAPFRLIPRSILFPPASLQCEQGAVIRIKNTSQKELHLLFSIQPRSFNTSGANCQFQQLQVGCESFFVKQAEVTVQKDEFADVDVLFKPLNVNYIAHSCKLMITCEGNAYQVPLFGLAGTPNISAHKAKGSSEIRVRNDGDGVAVVFNGQESYIVQPGASQLIQSGNNRFKVMHDGLRMLKEDEWQEMVQALGMEDLEEQLEHIIEENCVEIEAFEE